jgi:hypothetical protein
MTGITVDPDVLSEWTRLREEGFADLDMSLSSNLPATESIQALSDVVDGLHREWERAMETLKPRPGDEPPSPGEWHAIELPDGTVGIRVFECEQADIFIPRVVAALEQRGATGHLALLEWPATPTLPRQAFVLECRLLARGVRIHLGGRTYRWQPDPEARERLVQLAVGWLRGTDERCAPVLKASVFPPVFLAPGADVAERLTSAVESPGKRDVRVVTTTGFRVIAWYPTAGQLALISCTGDGPVIADWSAPLDSLRQALVAGAPDCAYGYIKRGTSPAIARNGYSLAEDWPRRSGHSANEIRSMTTTAFYDAYAPDAFSTQLLGPDYAGRIPNASGYQRRAVGDVVLLEHDDPAAWYETPFVIPRVDERDIADAEPPPVLRNARADLLPILFQPEVIPDA